MMTADELKGPSESVDETLARMAREANQEKKMAVTIEQVTEITKPPIKPMYSPHGYVIAADGTTYTLLHRWYHGVVLALLFPDMLKEFRVDMQDDDNLDPIPGTGRPLVMPEDREEINVFDFQKFEFAYHGKMPVIRICPDRRTGNPSVDLPEKCTPEQREALRLVMIESCGYSLTTKVSTDHRDMTLRDCMKFAETGGDVWMAEDLEEPNDEENEE